MITINSRISTTKNTSLLDALFGACIARSVELNPPPDPDSWRTVHEPDQRLETGLTDTYRYYHDHPGLEPIMRDIESLPIWVREQLADRLRRAVEVLSEGWSEGESKLRTAAISHALDFYTYRSLLLRQQLSIAQAVALMVRLVRAA